MKVGPPPPTCEAEAANAPPAPPAAATVSHPPSPPIEIPSSSSSSAATVTTTARLKRTRSPPNTMSTKRIKRNQALQRQQHSTSSCASAAAPQSKTKLVVHPAHGDGNCLFRSVSIQVYGDETWHDRVRADCVAYMRKDATHFQSFVSGESSFDAYLDQVATPGVYGDHLEIQALAELYNRPVIVYSTELSNAAAAGATPASAAVEQEEEFVYVQMNERAESCFKRVKTLNIFHAAYLALPNAAPIRLLYRGMCHYDAVVDPLHATVGVGLGLDSSFQPGKADLDLVQAATRETDLNATQEEMERMAILASLRDVAPGTAAAAAAAATGGECSDAVRELVVNGFPLDQVLLAQSMVGDSFDDMLAVLLSPFSHNNNKNL